MGTALTDNRELKLGTWKSMVYVLILSMVYVLILSNCLC